MNASFVQRVGLASALMLISGIGAANAAEYTWSEILIPSIGGNLSAFGLNDKGQVAVTSADGSKSGIYRGGIFTPLPAPPAGYRLTALGVNNAGIVTGYAFSPSDPTHEQGFVLSGSTYRFFSRPGWDNTEARAIANSGLITGYSFTSDSSSNAGFIYNPGTNSFTDATPPGSGTAGFSTTQGMNADGRISGDGRSDELGRYGFIWQQGALVKGNRVLEPFLARVTVGNSNTAYRGINDAGLVVGFTAAGFGFVGGDSRGFQPLVPPGGDSAGANVSCEGINNSNQVLCGVTDAAGNLRQFIGTPDANDQNAQ
jgi:hypothetical protein